MRSGITSVVALTWLIAASSVISAPIEGDDNERRLVNEAALNIKGRAAVVKPTKAPPPVQPSKAPVPVKSAVQPSKAPPTTSAPSVVPPKSVVAPSKSIVPVSSVPASVPSSVKPLPSSAVVSSKSLVPASSVSSTPPVASSSPISSGALGPSSASVSPSAPSSSSAMSVSGSGIVASQSASASSGASVASAASVSASSPSGSSAMSVSASASLSSQFASASSSASGPSGSSAMSLSASATASSQSASASSSALPAPPPCSTACLAPEPDLLTPDLLLDLDIDGAVAVSNNGTNTTTAQSRGLLSKRAARVVNLCGTPITSTANGDTTFRNGVSAAAPATAYTWTNPGAQDFDISGTSVVAHQPAPLYIIEHVFEFQIMKHFLDDNDALCGQAAVTGAFQDIVNLIDNPTNMVYAHTVINQVKLQVVAGNQFGTSSLETGFIAPGEFSSQLNDLGQQPAVDARTKAQLILRSTGGVIDYLNQVAPVFKHTATAVRDRLNTAQAGTGQTFTTWLEDEVEKYQGRVTFTGGLLAKNYQFQTVGRPNTLAGNNFNPAQMITDIGGNGFPTLSTDALMP